LLIATGANASPDGPLMPGSTGTAARRESSYNTSAGGDAVNRATVRVDAVGTEV
jgi:hypothetical protein